MEEIKSRYSTRESFISELAFAMSNHDIQERAVSEPDTAESVSHPARRL